MSAALIKKCDEAFHEFSELCDRVAAELGEMKVAARDLDAILEHRAMVQAAGNSFLFEAACALAENRTGKTILELMRGDVPRSGETLQ